VTDPQPPNLVQYLTLAAAIIAPAVAAVTTVYQIRRGERDKITVHAEWKMVEDEESIEEIPYVHIHNRSGHRVLVTEIRYAAGAFFKRGLSGTAKWYEDPFDLNFPYEIAPGEVLKLVLGEDEAERVFKKFAWQVRAWGWLRRRYIWLEVQTAGGAHVRIPGERALAYSKRPNWTIRDD
jgi:hypothetical protein